MRAALRKVAGNAVACTAAAILALAAAGVAATAQQWPPSSLSTPSGPDISLEDYLKEVGPEARLVAPGAFVIDGIRMTCGRRPTVVYSKFDSWGGAYPGFLIWNPDMTESLSTTLKLYVYAHECGHQFVGRDEMAADCFAVKRGRRYGWLDDAGMDEICTFISRLKATAAHPPGPRRCEHMRQCYADAVR